jgi:hypothetical protein
MTDARNHHYGYEPPMIEARAEIGPTLIGGAISSNTDVSASAAFTHI